MKSLKKSVLQSLDGSNLELYSFLPYILQDFWKIGSSPEIIFEVLSKNINLDSTIYIMDLGCGKGAVLINLAKKLNCRCIGIDAYQEFINVAINKSQENEVTQKCTFIVGDIRKEINNYKNLDVIIC